MTTIAGTGAPIGVHDYQQLVGEHHALVRHYGRAQVRCSEQLREQAGEIARLRAEAIRLRGSIVVRDTALAWVREERNDIAGRQAALYSSASTARRHHPGRRHAEDTREPCHEKT